MTDYDAHIEVSDDAVKVGPHEIRRPDGVTPANFRLFWDFARKRWNERGSLVEAYKSDAVSTPMGQFHRMVDAAKRRNDAEQKQMLEDYERENDGFSVAPVPGEATRKAPG